MKTAIVIGALGFIGYSLCNKLLEDGFEVIGIDCYDKDNSKKKIQDQKYLEIARNSNFKLLEMDITDATFETIRTCDVVYYCINNQTILESNFDIASNQAINNIRKVIQYCNQVNATFIYLSSYEVYQENLPILTQETRLEPRNLAGMLKVKEESEVLANHGSLNYYILRIPTIYGPWQPEYMSYQRLISTNTINSPMDVIREDTIYIYDLVSLMIGLPTIIPKKQVLLISSGNENYWLKGFNMLSEERQLNLPATKISLTETEKQLKKYIDTDLKDGLNEQKLHYNYINKLKSLDLL
ncbi:NAD-dependent epimerase/dehydratase family protein [Bacillus sp. Marseille-P3661]|uniref:NAD-dependent epimerase/dehydratase family protein n=1 Tax=Bacillus sp. Marseille-P3661 TaxID=1936234 RepID=UPI0015E181D0|nr:NAD(P)-dependent oxidoreductase [Bacillus sp. Marseille-P3661]